MLASIALIYCSQAIIGLSSYLNATNRSVDRSRDGRSRPQSWKRSPAIASQGGDYDACERVLVEGLTRFPVDLLTDCLMPDHWHLVVRPRTDVALGRLMGWVGVTHVRRHHEHYHRRGAGHLYQGRFKSFPVAEDDYFPMLCRYVKANAVRGKLEEELQVVRECVGWGRPLGRAQWVLATAARLRLGFTLRAPGRPRKTIDTP